MPWVSCRSDSPKKSLCFCNTCFCLAPFWCLRLGLLCWPISRGTRLWLLQQAWYAVCFWGLSCFGLFCLRLLLTQPLQRLPRGSPFFVRECIRVYAGVVAKLNIYLVYPRYFGFFYNFFSSPCFISISSANCALALRK